MERDAGYRDPGFARECCFQYEPCLVVEELGDPSWHDELGDHDIHDGPGQGLASSIPHVFDGRPHDVPEGAGNEGERRRLSESGPSIFDLLSLLFVHVDVDRQSGRRSRHGIAERGADGPCHIGDEYVVLDPGDGHRRKVAAPRPRRHVDLGHDDTRFEQQACLDGKAVAVSQRCEERPVGSVAEDNCDGRLGIDGSLLADALDDPGRNPTVRMPEELQREVRMKARPGVHQVV